MQPPFGYDRPEKILEMVKDIEKENKKIVKLIDLTVEYKTDRTWENRTLYAVKLSKNVEIDEDLPNRLIISNHHARYFL
jgi:hypothetical protein